MKKKRRAGPRTLKTSDWHFTKGHWTLDTGHGKAGRRAKRNKYYSRLVACCLLPSESL